GRRALPVLALAVTFVRVGHVDAAQLQALDLATLGARAALVVRGHVVATEVTPDGPLETVATVVVDACLAGSCPSPSTPSAPTIEITRRGGERAGVGLWVDGEATLAVGADVILYLRVDPRGHLRVLGGVQGALAVERDHAVRDLRGHQRRVDGTWQPGTREVISLAALRGQLAVTR
ncbi:MAG: hypothetical protein NT062_24635, partial [Proteobacteria bacterium]|nr:hypothetical protein [Pseudomonadota bacterium]